MLEKAETWNRFKTLAKFAALAPAMFFLGCGHVRVGNWLYIHDHRPPDDPIKGPNPYIRKNLTSIAYDPEIYGRIYGLKQEGEEIESVSRSASGEKPIHRHHGFNLSRSGPYEYQLE